MPRQHWLIKSEPSQYSWPQLVRDGKTMWEGVRNFEARNNLRGMKAGDLCLYYHSNDGKEIVGIARVAREAYPDPTAPAEDWSVVDVEPVAPIKQPVSLDDIKGDPELADIALLKRSRLSVVPVSKEHFDHILQLGKTRLAAKLLASKPPAPRPASTRPAAAKAPAAKLASSRAPATPEKTRSRAKA